MPEIAPVNPALAAMANTLRDARSVDICGNTDESWRRGLDYLLRNYLLPRALSAHRQDS